MGIIEEKEKAKFTKSQQIRVRITTISLELSKVIDKICTESGYEITYAEINSSLLQIMQRNNSREIECLINEEE
jgi:hypothetical protein